MEGYISAAAYFEQMLGSDDIKELRTIMGPVKGTSCYDLKQRGVDKDGFYLIGDRKLYCDMNRDGGGWTLVRYTATSSKRSCETGAYGNYPSPTGELATKHASVISTGTSIPEFGLGDAAMNVLYRSHDDYAFKFERIDSSPNKIFFKDNKPMQTYGINRGCMSGTSPHGTQYVGRTNGNCASLNYCSSSADGTYHEATSYGYPHDYGVHKGWNSWYQKSNCGSYVIGCYGGQAYWDGSSPAILTWIR